MPAPSAEVLAAFQSSHSVLTELWHASQGTKVKRIGRPAWASSLSANNSPLDESSTNPWGPDVNGELMAGGTVTLDTTSANMRTLTCTVAVPEGQPVPTWLKQENLLGRVHVRQGIAVDGAITWFACGVFGLEEIDEVTSSDAPGPTWAITGYDGSFDVSRAEFQKPWTANLGKPVHELIYDIIRATCPSVTRFNLKPTGVVPYVQSFQVGDEVWQACVELAQSAGMVLFFNSEGILTMFDVPTGAGSPVALDLRPGPNSMVNALTRTRSTQPGYNGIQVTGTTAKGKTFTVSVWDMNPASPTYAKGPYGQVPAPPIQLSSVATAAQAVKVAQALMPQVLGLTRSTAATIIPSPFLDAYDLVQIAMGDVGLNALEMVTGFTLPLDSSGLESLTTVPLAVPASEYVSAVAAITENIPPTFAWTP